MQTFKQWQRISDDAELKAAAAGAYVLDARLERRDVPPAQGVRSVHVAADRTSGAPALAASKT